MPGTQSPGTGTVTGDPWLTRFDKFRFKFPGRPGGTYLLFRHGPTEIRCTLSALPGMGKDLDTVITDMTITVGGVVEVAIPIDGQVKFRSPAFEGTLHCLFCCLPAHKPELADRHSAMDAQEYFNLAVDKRPDLGVGEGLWVDGDASPECEARYRLHPRDVATG